MHKQGKLLERFFQKSKQSNKEALRYAYDMGKDCRKNGANDTNCHFSIFNTIEKTKAWAKGKNGEKL